MTPLVSKAILNLSKREHVLLLLACIAYEKSNQSLIEINSGQLSDFLGEESSNEQIVSSLKTLFLRQFPLNQSFANSRWIDYYEFDKDASLIKISLSYATKLIFSDVFIALSSTHKDKNVNFTFKSVYTQRLYVILSDIIQTKQTERVVTCSTADLRNLLGVEPHEYSRMGALKKYVIDRAVNEFNLKTPYTIEYSQKYKGRSITHFTFVAHAKTDTNSNFKLSPKQVDYFADLLSKETKTHEKLPPPIGADMNQYKNLIIKSLSDPIQLPEWIDSLTHVGFKKS